MDRTETVRRFVNKNSRTSPVRKTSPRTSTVRGTNPRTETVRGFVETKKDKIEKKIAWGLVHLKKGSIEEEQELERLMGRAYRALDKEYFKTSQKHLNAARKYAHEHGLIPNGSGNGNDIGNGNNIGNEEEQMWLGKQLEQFGGFRQQHFQIPPPPVVQARAYPPYGVIPSDKPYPATPEEINELLVRDFFLTCNQCDKLRREHRNDLRTVHLCQRCSQLGEKVFPAVPGARDPLERPLPVPRAPYQVPAPYQTPSTNVPNIPGYANQQGGPPMW